MNTKGLSCAVAIVAAVHVAGSAGPRAGEDGAVPAAKIDQALATRVVAEVRDDVERLRGLRFERPVPVQVIDDAQAKQYMTDRVRRFGYDELMGIHQIAYTLLGLVPRDTDLFDLLLVALEEQAGGFYDPEDAVFYLLSDAPRGAAEVLVAHELTHALEDQHFDLDRRLRRILTDEDRLFAMSAVHEGSATLVMTAYSTAAVMSGEVSLADLRAMAESEAARGEVFQKLPSVLQRELLGPYVLGANFLARGQPLQAALRVPTENLAQAYRDGPQSSEQILHPERYWERRDDPRKVTVQGAKVLSGKGWKRVGGGTFGELILGVLVGAPTPSLDQAALMTSPASWTNEAAAGWGGDAWELWRRRQDHALLSMTVWDTAADAEEFAAALPAGIVFERDGDRVALGAGTFGEETRRVLERLLARGSRD